MIWVKINNYGTKNTSQLRNPRQTSKALPKL